MKLSWKDLKNNQIAFEETRHDFFRDMILKVRAIFLVKAFAFRKCHEKQSSLRKITVFDNGGDWVLKKITNAIISEIKLESEFCQIKTRIEDSSLVLFEHYLPYCDRYFRGFVPNERAVIWFTHLREHSFRIKDIIFALNHSLIVIFQCKHDRDLLMSWGLRRPSIVLNGGVEAIWSEVKLRKFEETSYDFLIASNNYPRKNPFVYQNLIEENPQFIFCFLGRGWEFLAKYRNVEILKSDYSEYPRIFADTKCLLSLSAVEGGPLSLLEAMHCGLPSVITQTGIYKECDSAVNVKIISSSNPVELDDCLSFAKSVRGTAVRQLSWPEFGRRARNEILKEVDRISELEKGF